jgi:anti-sigma factor RsiW
MATPIICPTERDGDDEYARQWAAGALSPAEAKEFETHLQTCTRCRRAVEYAAGVTADLRAAAHSKPEPRRGQPWWLWSILALTAAGLLIVALRFN